MSWNGIQALFENQALMGAVKTVGQITLIVVIAFVATRLMRKAARRVDAKVAEHTTPLRNLQRTRTLATILSSTGAVIIWSIAGIYVLVTLDYNIAPLLASVGVVGLAVGFGAQSLVKDVITGFFILLEDQYGVGDIVEINQAASGKVEHLTLRVTALRALDGTLHFFSNGDISHVANRSKDWARAVIDVGVAYKEDPVRVRTVLEKVAAEAHRDGGPLSKKMYSEPEVLGVEVLGEYEVIWRLLVDTKPGKQWEVGRDLRERIKVAFDQDGIEIPYPHHVLISAEASDPS